MHTPTQKVTSWKTITMCKKMEICISFQLDGKHILALNYTYHIKSFFPISFFPPFPFNTNSWLLHTLCNLHPLLA